MTEVTEVTEITEENLQKIILEGNEIVLGSVEVHAKCVKVRNDSGIMIDYKPAFGATAIPDWMADINARLAGLVRTGVMAMNDQARIRLLAMLERCSGDGRMLYRLFVTSRVADDGSHENRVRDLIDPDFASIDKGLEGRARAGRQRIERVLLEAIL